MMTAPAQPAQPGRRPADDSAALLAEYQAVSAECQAAAKEAIGRFAHFDDPPVSLVQTAIELHGRFIQIATRLAQTAGTDYRRHASIHRRIADLTDLIATLEAQVNEWKAWAESQIAGSREQPR